MFLHGISLSGPPHKAQTNQYSLRLHHNIYITSHLDRGLRGCLLYGIFHQWPQRIHRGTCLNASINCLVGSFPTNIQMQKLFLMPKLVILHSHQRHVPPLLVAPPKPLSCKMCFQQKRMKGEYKDYFTNVVTNILQAINSRNQSSFKLTPLKISYTMRCNPLKSLGSMQWNPKALQHILQQLLMN